MAWNRRGYFYRCERTPAGPRNVYYGAGLIAHLTEQLDIQRVAIAKLDAEQRRRERQQERELDAELDGHYGELRTHVHGVLVASGWYSHKREWRRYTVQLEGDTMTRAEIEALAGGNLDALISRCNVAAPAPSDLAALRKVVDMPSGAILRALSGTVLAEDIIGGAGAVKIVTSAELDRLRHDLGADDCPPVERSLIDHVCVCWARMQVAERRLTSATSGTHTPPEGLYWERRTDHAQRRYLRALALLAKMRALTSVQVNIATNQQVVNR